jgi:C4-dicarboxylate-specific signal transduction histidine kinase
MRGGPRLLLTLVALAAAGASAVVLLALGLPLLARRALDGERFVALVLFSSAAAAGVASLLLHRLVAGPLEGLLATAGRLGARDAAGLPVLGESGAHGLPSAAVAFERVASALEEERGRLAAKVEELTHANHALAEARESLLRSEKLATVGRLAAGLAHEVGNPLGAVTGYAERARARLPPDADPELSDALTRIGSAAERIDRTVRGLLDFARPASPALGPVELRAVLEASLGLARVQGRFRHVEVALELGPRLPQVVADEHQLTQVFVNLFLNAGDALGGTGRVWVRARPAGERVVVEVEDSGPGIAPGDLARIFDPFFTTKEPGQGTGLGLAISHRILESMGGEIGASAAPGAGARFTLQLRAAAPPTAAC